MKSESRQPLLGQNDPSPVTIINPEGRSPFLLIGDHAGKTVPAALDRLGLDERELDRHIGWDIGIGVLGPILADALDAPFIRQTYSRLVVDCNRSADKADAVAAVSDGTPVPGNAALSDADRAQRFADIHEPYQAAIAAALARRDAEGRDTILVALHSFTPRMRGVARPWHVGVLHDRGNLAFAHAVLDRLGDEPELCVGDNEPYRMDAIDYTIPRHAYPARPYAELEIRQDLIATDAGAAAWAERLARVLRAAAASTN